jgi:hypothetical protein
MLECASDGSSTHVEEVVVVRMKRSAAFVTALEVGESQEPSF